MVVPASESVVEDERAAPESTVKRVLAATVTEVSAREPGEAISNEPTLTAVEPEPRRVLSEATARVNISGPAKRSKP